MREEFMMNFSYLRHSSQWVLHFSRTKRKALLLEKTEENEAVTHI